MQEYLKKVIPKWLFFNLIILLVGIILPLGIITVFLNFDFGKAFNYYQTTIIPVIIFSLLATLPLFFGKFAQRIVYVYGALGLALILYALWSLYYHTGSGPFAGLGETVIIVASLIFYGLSQIVVNFSEKKYLIITVVILLLSIAPVSYWFYVEIHDARFVKTDQLTVESLCRIYNPSLTAEVCDEIFEKISTSSKEAGLSPEKDFNLRNICYTTLAWRGRNLLFCNKVVKDDYSQINKELCQKIVNGSEYDYVSYVKQELKDIAYYRNLTSKVKECAGRFYE